MKVRKFARDPLEVKSCQLRQVLQTLQVSFPILSNKGHAPDHSLVNVFVICSTFVDIRLRELDRTNSDELTKSLTLLSAVSSFPAKPKR